MSGSSVAHSPMLRALDPDLPFLAAEVAIDIDNMLLGTSNDRTAMRRLAKKLSQGIEPDPDGGPLRSRMDVATLAVLGEAVSETRPKQSMKSIADLLTRTHEITAVLASDNPEDSDRQRLEQAMSFCVALSRATAAYSESIQDMDMDMDMDPSYPGRR